MTSLSLIGTFLLALSFTNAINFTTVFTWDEMDYEWLSAEQRLNALRNNSFKPRHIEPRYMAVFEKKLFLSLNVYYAIPVTLVWLPINSSPAEPPKLAPFPSWEKHRDHKKCDSIQASKGLEIDVIGRLWVLDGGASNCPAKLWIFNLTNNDEIDHVHEFSVNDGPGLNDLVLEATPNGWFAYITRYANEHILVFSLKEDKSWLMYKKGEIWMSIAISPQENPRLIYLGKYNSSDLYSIPVADFQSEIRNENLKIIRKLTAEPYRMLIDNAGTVYAAFYGKNYTSTWKISKQLQEKRFYVPGILGSWPFTFALSSSGTLWMMVFYESGEPKYRLQKAEVGVMPYLYNISTETSTTTTTPTLAIGKDKENKTCNSNNAKHQSLLILNTILSCWNVFCLFSIASQIYWFRKMKRMQDLIAKTKEDREKMCKEPLVNREIQPHVTSEPIYEEIDPVPSTSMHTAIADIHL